MPLSSLILAGCPRLEQAATVGPSIKVAPPADDADAVRRIQKALVALGHPLPLSFPNGPGREPDGRFGNETFQAVIAFQKRVFPTTPREWDGRLGPKTLGKMDAMLPKAAPVAALAICGPDVTDQIVAIWKQIEADFDKWTLDMKLRACNTILIPFRRPESPDNSGIPTNLEELKKKLQLYADINGWDTVQLYQGASKWLRSPPIFDSKTNGPCATPSSVNPDADDFDPSHEQDHRPDGQPQCSNTVQVKGECWLNGTVNYGTFGVMVRKCSDLASADWRVKAFPVLRAIYSLGWAKTLIKAYKKFGGNPESAVLPIAWLEATFNNGPTGVPNVSGNRPKCKCSCGCKGDVVAWDYVWEPLKTRDKPYR